MSRWKVTVKESSGRALITLRDRNQTAGVVNISASDYESLCNSFMTGFIKIAKTKLVAKLNEKLWQDAQRRCDEDAEAAMKMLTAWGWNSESINRLADEMVIKLAEELISNMPEQEQL